MKEIELTFRTPSCLDYSRIFSKTIAQASYNTIQDASYFLAIPVEGAALLSIFENIHVAQLRKYEWERFLEVPIL